MPRLPLAIAACVLGTLQVAAAQEAPPDSPPPERDMGPGLLGPGLVYANEIERAAAVANDFVFRTLEPDCNPDGVLDTIAFPAFGDIEERQAEPGPLCNPDSFWVFLTARELTHTANAIEGQGPTVASLGLDQEGLGLALRWTAAEELAAQGSMATQFTNGQLSSLAARLNAIRLGATGFSSVMVHDWMRDGSPVLAQVGGESVPAESAPDSGSSGFSPWGGFFNFGYGYGSREPTSLENAFDFDSSEWSLGVDYRFGSELVVGGVLGYSRQAIDFDAAASAISVVDGGIRANGRSLIAFAMSQGENLTLSASVGLQSLRYRVERNIKYPSFNPELPPVHSAALSEPDANVLTATLGLAYAWRWERFTLEPFVDAAHVRARIGAFSEERSLNLLRDTEESRRFDLAVSSQSIRSLRSAAGLRFQYVLTPRYGVFLPYLIAAVNGEHNRGSRTITTGYAALEDVLGTQTFELPTDPLDSSYFTVTGGVSAVLRGARARTVDGPAGGGLMGFVQFATVQNRAHYRDRVFTAGLRYEFFGF